MCMRHTSTPASATTAAICGSARSAVTSLTTVAPASIAARATSALEVSIEICALVRAASSATTGATRAREPARRFAFGPAGRRGRRGQLGLELGLLGEDLLLALAVEQREELLLLDRLAPDEDLGDLFEVGSVFGEDVLRALVRRL